MAQLPAFEHTDIDSIAPTVNGIRSSFLTHKTRDLNFRLVQLRKLYWAYVMRSYSTFSTTRSQANMSMSD